MPVVDSIRGLADALGVNESSVRKAERSGRIALERDEQGNIDVENVKQQWNSNRRTSGGSESGTGVSYQKSRANKELFEALLKKLEYEERSGKLVELSKMEVDAFTAARVARDKLLAIPDRLAPTLVGVTDIHEMKEVLRKEILATLQNLTDFLHAGTESG
jgi:hypothetical protein